MSGKYGANAYRQTSVTTANRGQLLLMLYEAAINHIKRAILAIERKDLSNKGMAIGKAHDIINELQNTLDFEVGGQVARDLDGLYNFMTDQLVKANLEGSKERLQSIQKLLETLLEGWRGAVAQVNKAQGTQGTQGK